MMSVTKLLTESAI